MANGIILSPRDIKSEVIAVHTFLFVLSEKNESTKMECGEFCHKNHHLQEPGNN